MQNDIDQSRSRSSAGSRAGMISSRINSSAGWAKRRSLKARFDSSSWPWNTADEVRRPISSSTSERVTDQSCRIRMAGSAMVAL